MKKATLLAMVGCICLLSFSPSFADTWVVDPIAAKTIVADGVNVRALYDVDDVIWAIETLLQYADGTVHSIDAVYYTPAAALRRAADAAEKKDADLTRARKILDALKR